MDAEKGVRSGAYSDAIFQKAVELARSYHIVVRESATGGFIANCAELPVSIHRDQAEDALKAARHAAEVGIATILEDGEEPPAPIEFHRRTEQVNVRMSVEDKRLIQKACEAKGISSLSEFFRRSTVNAAAIILGMNAQPERKP